MKLARDISVYILAVALAGCCLSSCRSSRRVAVVVPVAGSTTSGVSVADPAMASDIGQAVVREARRWLGTKYVYGGHSRSGTDCSGLVMEVFLKSAGMKLPRTTVDQRAFSAEISRDRLCPGDLVFFSSKKNTRRVSHVGVYIGGGEIIHASSSRGVIVSRLSDDYYRRNYHSSGRVLASVGSKGKGNKRPSKQQPSKHQQSSAAVPVPVMTVTPELEPVADDLLDDILTRTIDSIYSAPVQIPLE